MSLRLFKLDEKLSALQAEIVEARRDRRDPGSNEQRHYEILKAIAADIRARMEAPRSNALGELERAMERMTKSKTALGYYDVEKMAAVAQVIISKWPHVNQALESFGEESAE